MMNQRETLAKDSSPFRIRMAGASLLLLAALAPSLAAAQQRTAGQRAILAFEAARADAYRNLLESVRGLRVQGGTTVENLAVTSSDIRTSLESFVRGANVVEETMASDGTARVVVELDMERLERLLGRDLPDGLQRLTMEGYGAPPADSTPAATGQSGRAVETVVTGSPTAWNRGGEQGSQEIAGVVTIVGTAAQDLERARSVAQARLLAERAATTDAYRRLLEYVYGISVSSTTTVRDLVLASDRVDSQVSGFIRGARVEGVRHTPDGVAHVSVSLDLSGLRRLLNP